MGAGVIIGHALVAGMLWRQAIPGTAPYWRWVWWSITADGWLKQEDRRTRADQIRSTPATETPGGPMRHRRVNGDADRERIRRFFADHLQDETGFPLLDRAFDTKIGLPSILRIIEDDDGDLLAAIYASNDPEDVLQWRSIGEYPIADVISTRMLMVHKLAVLPIARRQGLGRQLIDAVIDDGRASRAALVTLLFDDTRPGLRTFYQDVGFRIQAHGARLDVEFAELPRRTIGFPQDDPTYCWAVRVLDPSRARCANGVTRSECDESGVPST